MRFSLVLLFLLAIAGVFLSTVHWLPDRGESALPASPLDRGSRGREQSLQDSSWPPPPTRPIARRPAPVEELSAGTLPPSSEYRNIVRGRVLDGEGEPVAEALVAVELPGVDRGAGGEILTDKDGRFELRGVAPGDSHRIGIRHPELACAGVTDVRVTAEGTTELGTITLRPATRLHGIVRDAAKRPIAGARLRLLHDSRAACEPLNREPVEILSDADGRYEFPHASPCQGTIVVEADGCANLRLSGLADRIRSGREAQLDLFLAPPRRISGAVVDLDGEPISGAELIAGLEPWLTRRCVEETHSGPDGRFELTRLTAGRYSIAARARGYRIVSTRAHTNESGVRLVLSPLRTVCGVVLSEAGSPVDPFYAWLCPPQVDAESGDRSPWGESFPGTNGRFELQDVLYGPCVVAVSAPGYATGFSEVFWVEGSAQVDGIEVRLVRLGSISAVAVDESGRPIPGAQLVVWYARGEFQPNPLLEGRFASTGRATAAADEWGRCEVRDLPEGDYGIRIEAEGFAEHSALNVPVRNGVNLELGRVFLRSGRYRAR